MYLPKLIIPKGFCPLKSSPQTTGDSGRILTLKRLERKGGVNLALPFPVVFRKIYLFKRG